MTLAFLNGIGIYIVVCIFLAYVLAPTKNQTKIYLWSCMMLLCAGLALCTWNLEDVTYQWVLIEATTFLASLLISSSRTPNSFSIAWKFLLLNSYGLGIAFLGLIVLSASLYKLDYPVNELTSMLRNRPESMWIEIGLWLSIFGYSAKLGLYPNHSWVGGTYGGSPSQISAIIASFIPVAVCFAIRPLVKIDHQLFPNQFSASDALLILGLFTMAHSILALYERDDIRSVTAKVALFHTGTLAVFLWLDLEETLFLFVMAGTLLIKSLLFLSMGIVRMDAGTKHLSKMIQSNSINKIGLFFFLLVLFLAFILPGSPSFLNDLILIRAGVLDQKFWILIAPVLGLIFFAVLIFKVLPLWNLEQRPFAFENVRPLKIRMVNAFFILILLCVVGVWGLELLVQGKI